MRIRVKFCGITRREDALAAIEAGADALGLVFYAPSPRGVDFHQAWCILQGLPPFVSVVGLFVNPTVETVQQAIQQLPISHLQFHGDEDNAFCQQFNMPWYKAIRVRPEMNLSEEIARFPQAHAILLDAYHPQLYGGSGQTFDWAAQWPREVNKPLILAGGLTPENAAEAVRQVQPYALDVSGGIEAEKGIKSRDKMFAFVRAVTSSSIPY